MENTGKDSIIRKVTEEDARAYVACHIACWQAAYRGIIPDSYLDAMPEDLDERTETFRRSLKDPGVYKYYCVESEGEIVGRLIFCKSRDTDRPDVGEVGAIYLLPAFWDTGLGRRMMDFALENLRQMGFSTFIVWVLEENTRARRFYEKCGFVHDGKRKIIKVGKALVEIRYVIEGEDSD